MRKKDKLKILDTIKVSSPCENDNFSTNSTETKSGWYCGECKKEVYDLSKFSQDQIFKLIDQTNGNFCALIKRGPDGSLITKEPTSYTQALLATGAIIASTALIQNVEAQEQDTKKTTHESPNQQVETLGMVKATPIASPIPTIDKKNQDSGSCEKADDQKNVTTLGEVSIPSAPTHTRGKVYVDPKIKK